MKSERLSPRFAVFNATPEHLAKADQEFIAQFGQANFEQWVKPRHEEGIMTILYGPQEDTANPKVEAFFQGVWIALCTLFVNTDLA